MRQGPTVKALWGIAVLTGAVWACETTRNPGGIQRDLTPPVITLTSTADTQDIASGLGFGINAADNLALRNIRLIFSGGHIDTTDTTFVGQTTTVSISQTVSFPANSGAGGLIQIVARAFDGAGNSAEDTLFIFLANVQALIVLLNAPQPGAVASTGRGIPIQVTAFQNSGIRKVGFLVSPATAVSNPSTPPSDSLQFTLPYPDSVFYADTLIVQASTGFFVVVGFAEDSAGRRGTSATVTVNIQSAANDTSKPVVSHSIGARVEVNDSITVRATDPSAIAWIGFEVRDAGGALLRFDTVDVSAGNLTDVTRVFSLNLGTLLAPPYPKSIIVRGYACDAAVARNCAFSTTSTVIGTPQFSRGGALFTPAAVAQAGVDTVVVVAGVTKPLPFGGRIADAIFNGNDSTLYLTNPVLSRVEIFQVANTSFVAAGIPTAGPQPWGVALWPRNTDGDYADTIVVANSGGTQLSIIDVSPGVRRLLWRQDLPDFLIETYKIQGTTPVQELITVFPVSDRPQYVGTVCRVGSTPPLCDRDSIFAIYSTTPTVSSTPPFNGRATLRMEKLRNPAEFNFNPDSLFGHLFWELAGDSTLAVPGQDTLRIELRRGRPYNQQKVILSACLGVMIDLSRFGLGDSTYVRNSGDFTHAFVGEGGNITTQFARVVGYTTKANLVHGSGTALSCSPATGISEAGENHRDLGVTPAVDVSNFVANKQEARVLSIAINFNGGTHLVRADSIYYLDEGLVQKGMSVVPSGASGMDMNYNHSFLAGTPGTPTFGGTLSPNDRLAFAARPDANIDVFDTFFYGQVGSIPVRDPIIGPLRVARNAANTRQWLFGVTARGVVMVELPIITNPFPQVVGPTIP